MLPGLRARSAAARDPSNGPTAALPAESYVPARRFQAGEHHRKPEKVVGQLPHLTVDRATNGLPSVVRLPGRPRWRRDFQIGFRLGLCPARAEDDLRPLAEAE